MAKFWQLSAPAKFKEIKPNMFVIRFATHVDKLTIEDEQPWLFENNYFAIKKFDGYTQAKKMKFEYTSMWLQSHNLPLNGMNQRCGQQIGESIGTVKEVNVDKEAFGWGHTLQIKVHMDLTKPIA